jgi:hypothetical protein
MATAFSPRLRRSLTFARAISKGMLASRRICARRGEADARINFIFRDKTDRDYIRILAGKLPYAFGSAAQKEFRQSTPWIAELRPRLQ